MKKELLLSLKQYDSLVELIKLENSYFLINVSKYKIVIENNELKLFRFSI